MIANERQYLKAPTETTVDEKDKKIDYGGGKTDDDKMTASCPFGFWNFRDPLVLGMH